MKEERPEKRREEKRREEKRREERREKREDERENYEREREEERKDDFFQKMFEDPQTRQMNPKMFRKKSLSDELFLHFSSKVQNLTVFQLFT